MTSPRISPGCAQHWYVASPFPRSRQSPITSRRAPAGDQGRIVHSEARGLMDIESKNFDVAVMQGIE